MLIGGYITEIQMKQLWEVHALRGQKAIESVREGARVRRKRSDAIRYAAVTGLVDAGRTLRWSFTKVAKKEQSADSTISKSYYREKHRLERK